MSDQTDCSYCGKPMSPAFEATDVNRRVSDHRFRYQGCAGCGLISLTNVPEDLDRYYRDDYYATGDAARVRRISKKNDHLLDALRSVGVKGHLVDVGAAFGLFAYTAQRAGLTVTAVEQDTRCCEFMRDELGIDVVRSSDPATAISELGPVNAITMFHLIEHLANPWEALTSSAESLVDGGALLVATPNPHAWQFKFMGSHWPHVDAPRHLHLITPQLLIDAAAKLDLKLANLTSNDRAGQLWNRFGWQRLLMNRTHRSITSKLAFGLGALAELPARPWDRRELRGCCYTAVFVKGASSHE